MLHQALSRNSLADIRVKFIIIVLLCEYVHSIIKYNFYVFLGIHIFDYLHKKGAASLLIN